MRAKTIFLAPALLIAALSLSACSGATATPATSTAPAATSAAAAEKPSSAASTSAPAPAQTPSNVPGSGLYLLLTGESGEAQVSIVHYYGGKSESERKDGDNYKEQALKVKVPGYVKVDLANLSQITEKSTKDGQLLGCDFVYNGQFRPKNNPYAADTAATNFCYDTGFASYN